MKTLAALPLAALLALGAATGAQAFWPTIGQGTDRTDSVRTTEAEAAVDEQPHHPCHGMAAGTHHRACGSTTGGPAGGLF